jgi:hypothetical protein
MGGRMKTFHMWLLAAISTCGCSQPDTGDSTRARRPIVMDQVVVTTTDGQTFQGPSARVEITAPLSLGPAARASMAISTVDRDGQGLSLALDLAPSALFEPRVAVTLDDASRGTLALSSATDVEIIRSGQVALTLDHGTLEGLFEVDHPLISGGSLRGTFNVTCLVPPEMLGQTFRGRTSPGTWLLVEDEAHQSSFCQSFAGL